MTMTPDKKSSVTISSTEFTANSAITLDTSSDETKSALLSWINKLALGGGDPSAELDINTGNFVSRVGNARVVWRRKDDKILVISVYIP